MGLFDQSYDQLPTFDKTLSGTQIPSWASAAGRYLTGAAMELASSPYPQYMGARRPSYGGNTLTADELAGNQMLRDNAGDTRYMDAAYAAAGNVGQEMYSGQDYSTLVGEPMTIDQMQPYLDMYQQSVDPAISEIQKQIERNQNTNRANAARAGAFGGSRLGIQEGQTYGEGMDAMAQTRAEAGRAGLEFGAGQSERDRQARFQANTAGLSAYESREAARQRRAQELQSYVPLSQDLTQTRASNLIGMGEKRRAVDQQGYDLSYADYLDQRNYPYEQINYATGILEGVPYNSQNYSYNTGMQNVATPSVFGQIVGGLGTLGSAYFMGRNR
jgi:hypothetical protein